MLNLKSWKVSPTLVFKSEGLWDVLRMGRSSEDRAPWLNLSTCIRKTKERDEKDAAVPASGHSMPSSLSGLYRREIISTAFLEVFPLQIRKQNKHLFLYIASCLYFIMETKMKPYRSQHRLLATLKNVKPIAPKNDLGCLCYQEKDTERLVPHIGGHPYWALELSYTHEFLLRCYSNVAFSGRDTNQWQAMPLWAGLPAVSACVLKSPWVSRRDWNRVLSWCLWTAEGGEGDSKIITSIETGDIAHSQHQVGFCLLVCLFLLYLVIGSWGTLAHSLGINTSEDCVLSLCPSASA